MRFPAASGADRFNRANRSENGPFVLSALWRNKKTCLVLSSSGVSVMTWKPGVPWFHISQDALHASALLFVYLCCSDTQVSVRSASLLLSHCSWRHAVYEEQTDRDVQWGLNEITGIRLLAREQSLCKWATARLLQEEYQWSNYCYTTGRCLSPRSLSHTHTHTQRGRKLIKRVSGRKSFPEGRRHLNTAKWLLGFLQEPTAQIKWLKSTRKKRKKRKE